MTLIVNINRPVTLRLRCHSCGSGPWTMAGTAGELLSWVAGEVGHPIESLDHAVQHICCPTCHDTTLVEVPMPSRATNRARGRRRRRGVPHR